MLHKEAAPYKEPNINFNTNYSSCVPFWFVRGVESEWGKLFKVQQVQLSAD